MKTGFLRIMFLQAFLYVIVCLFCAQQPCVRAANLTADMQTNKGSSLTLNKSSDLDLPDQFDGSYANPSLKESLEKIYNKSALHRLDFRIEGKSCPVCLLGIERKIKSEPGVIRAAVMIKRPFGASTIYDASKTSQKKILEAAQLNEPEMRLKDIKDQIIKRMPTVFVPPHHFQSYADNSKAALDSSRL